MFRIGLTGNAASGKSTVAEHLRRWGAVTIDADLLARQAVERGTDALQALVRRFGPDILQPDGTLDRAALRHRVLRDGTALRDLNAIVHPAVGRLRDEREREAAEAGARIIVHDIPLLFEALDPASFDAVVLVDAPADLRRRRLVEDRGMAPEEADALIAAQLPAETKRARSHYVIDNAGSRAALEARTREVWGELQRRAGLA